MDYKKIEEKAYNIHFIKTKKFKTIKIKINFKELIDREKITYRNLLSNVILESSKNYKTRRLIEIKCEDLYDAGIGSGTIISGNYNILSFSTTFLNEKYTEKGLNEETFKFLLDFIFNPNIIDGAFTDVSFKNAYNILKNDIESLDESYQKYAYTKLLENMFPIDIHSYRGAGYIEDLEKITSKKLYDYFKLLLKNNLIDIFIVGDFDEDKMRAIIDKNFRINTIKARSKSHLLEVKQNRLLPQIVKESKPINQSVLFLGGIIKNLTDDERLYVLPIYNAILGGSPNSYLFREVREKNSLCYSISSSYSIIGSTFTINAGIDKKDFKKAVRLIKQGLRNMRIGYFDEKLIDQNILSFKTSLIEFLDSPSAMINIYEGHEYLNLDLVEERKKKIDSVNKAKIVKLAKKIKLDTIYLLEGENSNEED